MLSRSDLRLMRRAVIGGYNLSAEQRQDIVRRAHEILMSEATPDDDGVINYRDQLAAAKVLLSADKLDLDVVKAEQPAAQQNHLHLHDSFATMSQDELRASIADRIARLESRIGAAEGGTSGAEPA